MGRILNLRTRLKLARLYQVSKGIEKKVIMVTGLLENRADAKTVINFYEDKTPIEETYGFKTMFHAPVLKRDRGTGRPTKRDRREIDDLQGDFFNNKPIEAYRKLAAKTVST